MAKDETCALEAHVCVCLCLLAFLTAAEKVVLEPHWRQVPAQSHATRFTRVASRVGCGKRTQAEARRQTCLEGNGALSCASSVSNIFFRNSAQLKDMGGMSAAV